MVTSESAWALPTCKAQLVLHFIHSTKRSYPGIGAELGAGGPGDRPEVQAGTTHPRAGLTVQGR